LRWISRGRIRCLIINLWGILRWILRIVSTLMLIILITLGLLTMRNIISLLVTSWGILICISISLFNFLLFLLNSILRRKNSRTYRLSHKFFYLISIFFIYLRKFFRTSIFFLKVPYFIFITSFNILRFCNYSVAFVFYLLFFLLNGCLIFQRIVYRLFNDFLLWILILIVILIIKSSLIVFSLLFLLNFFKLIIKFCCLLA
jgi:hypothetical protein